MLDLCRPITEAAFRESMIALRHALRFGHAARLSRTAPGYSLTCTTLAGGKPLNQVAEALL
jgi:hypothetical protein